MECGFNLYHYVFRLYFIIDFNKYEILYIKVVSIQKISYDYGNPKIYLRIIAHVKPHIEFPELWYFSVLEIFPLYNLIYVSNNHPGSPFNNKFYFPLTK